MNRRAYLQAAGVAGIGSLTGCLGGIVDDRPENVFLSPPDDHNPDVDLPYPSYGEQLPSVSLHDPLTGEKITTTAFARPTYVTFFYTSCVSVCPLLISNLRSVQLDTVDSGYSDDVVFLPITFDPPRDTERTLRAYGNRMNVDFDVGNWHFLRPESNTRAKEAVTDTFGITYERTESSHTEYEFVHSMIILLANADGYVERVYRGARPQAEQIQTDLKTLRNRSDSG